MRDLCIPAGTIDSFECSELVKSERQGSQYGEAGSADGITTPVMLSRHTHDDKVSAVRDCRRDCEDASCSLRHPRRTWKG